MSNATDGTAAASERSLWLARASRAVTGLPPASYFLTSAILHYLGPPPPPPSSRSGAAPGGCSAPSRFPQHWVLLELGAILAAMNSLFYLAIDQLPLATVGAIEFPGTVVLAAAGARTRRNLLALALATDGVLALTAVPLAGEPLGFIFAFANCAGFMLYVTSATTIANVCADGSRPGQILDPPVPSPATAVSFGLAVARQDSGNASPQATARQRG